MSDLIDGSGFDGRVAIITGGAGGVGQAVAAALNARGAHVATFDQREAEPAAMSLIVDVRDEQAVSAAAADVERELGPIAMLVCAAGVVSEAPVTELEPAEWRRVVDVSLTGTYLATRAVVPSIRRGGGGSVVAYSSGYAAKGYRNGSHYAAAKAGVEALVKSLALEVAGDGIRVNAIAPGPIATDFVNQVSDDIESWSSARAAHIPMGRVAVAADLVGPTLFLLGESSAYVTGQVLQVNGGLLMP